MVLYFPLFSVISKASGTLNSRKNMRDHRFHQNPSRCHQTHRVLKMCRGADVPKKIPKALFPKKIDIQWKRIAKPGNTDDLGSPKAGVLFEHPKGLAKYSDRKRLGLLLRPHPLKIHVRMRNNVN
jgi:hypothetical protein